MTTPRYKYSIRPDEDGGYTIRFAFMEWCSVAKAWVEVDNWGEDRGEDVVSQIHHLESEEARQCPAILSTDERCVLTAGHSGRHGR